MKRNLIISRKPFMNKIHIGIIISLFITACVCAHDKEGTHPRPFNAGVRVFDVKIRNRTTTAAIWYPTNSPEKPHKYGSENSTNTGRVAVDAPLAQNRDSFPFLFYSHGFGGSALGHTHLAEPLARQGWIVVAPDHDDAVNATRIRSGRNPHGARQLLKEARKLVRNGRNFDFEKYAYRLEDVRAVMKHVADMDAFSGTIDEERMAIGGHSFGGYTSAGICGAVEKFRDDRFDALILHSPGVWMYTEEDLAKIDVPVLYMLGEKETRTQSLGRAKRGWASLVLNTIKAPGYYAEVKDGRHTAFNTAQRDHFFARRLSGSPEQLETVRQQTTSFLKYHVLGYKDARDVLINDADGLSKQWQNKRAKTQNQ